MGRSQETYGKKEKEKRKAQKRKEKEQRREERKANADKSFDDMIAYVDEFGNITSTPPDETKKKEEVNVEDIVIGARNSGKAEEEDPIKEGIVSFFNDSKGYGFIKELKSGESIFVHVNGLIDQIKENDKVSFEMERGPKGMVAVRVQLVKK